jgi:hypothetical protein
MGFNHAFSFPGMGYGDSASALSSSPDPGGRKEQYTQEPLDYPYDDPAEGRYRAVRFARKAQ